MKNNRPQARRNAIREERAARRAHLAQRLEEFKEAEKHEYYGDERLAKEAGGYRPPNFIYAVALVVLVVAVLTLLGCGAPSAEQLWLAEQVERCRAQNGNYSYNENAKEFECFRTPFMRQPKRLFKKNYLDDRENTTGRGRA